MYVCTIVNYFRENGWCNAVALTGNGSAKQCGLANMDTDRLPPQPQAGAPGALRMFTNDERKYSELPKTYIYSIQKNIVL